MSSSSAIIDEALAELTIENDGKPAREVKAARAGEGKQRVSSILGLGYSLPDAVVGNHELAEHLGIDDEWIVRRMGINARRRAAPEVTLVDIAADAGREALKDAKLSAEDIDLILVGTLTPDRILPTAAPLVAKALGATKAGAMDVGAACVGWLSSLALACGQVESGRANNVLVIGADLLSRVIDYDDKRTAPLFGDAAGAVVVGATGSGTIGPIVLDSDGALGDAISIDYCDRKVRMDGHETFKIATKVLSESTEAACARAGHTLDEVDLFVYHQANGRILQAVGERLGLPEEKVANYISEVGNTSSASIPLSLAFARAEGRVKAGDRILVGSVGAGFVWGACLLEWDVK
jgi:3-oxoacyl-[acyl-carrier-protein] synthase-3